MSLTALKAMLDLRIRRLATGLCALGIATAASAMQCEILPHSYLPPPPSGVAGSEFGDQLWSGPGILAVRDSGPRLHIYEGEAETWAWTQTIEISSVFHNWPLSSLKVAVSSNTLLVSLLGSLPGSDSGLYIWDRGAPGQPFLLKSHPSSPSADLLSKPHATEEFVAIGQAAPGAFLVFERASGWNQPTIVVTPPGTELIDLDEGIAAAGSLSGGTLHVYEHLNGNWTKTGTIVGGPNSFAFGWNARIARDSVIIPDDSIQIGIGLRFQHWVQQAGAWQIAGIAQASAGQSLTPGMGDHFVHEPGKFSFTSLVQQQVDSSVDHYRRQEFSLEDGLWVESARTTASPVAVSGVSSLTVSPGTTYSSKAHFLTLGEGGPIGVYPTTGQATRYGVSTPAEGWTDLGPIEPSTYAFSKVYPLLSVETPLAAPHDLHIEIGQALSGAQALLLRGSARGLLEILPGAFLNVDGGLSAIPITIADNTYTTDRGEVVIRKGTFQLDLPLPPTLPQGTLLTLQAVVFDPAAGNGLSATNGVEIVVP